MPTITRTITMPPKAAFAKVGDLKPRTIIVKASHRTLERDMMDGTSRCIGRCKCLVEPDGHCPQGYPSRFMILIG